MGTVKARFEKDFENNLRSLSQERLKALKESAKRFQAGERLAELQELKEFADNFNPQDYDIETIIDRMHFVDLLAQNINYIESPNELNAV